jgi:hypothetical protein
MRPLIDFEIVRHAPDAAQQHAPGLGLAVELDLSHRPRLRIVFDLVNRRRERAGQFRDLPQPERVNDFETPDVVRLVSKGV